MEGTSAQSAGTNRQPGRQKSPEERRAERDQRKIEIAQMPDGRAVRITNPLQKTVFEISKDMGPIMDRLQTDVFSSVVTYDPLELLKKVSNAVKILSDTVDEISGNIGFIRNKPIIYRTAEDEETFKKKMKERNRNRNRRGGNGGENAQAAETEDKTTAGAGLGDLLTQDGSAGPELNEENATGKSGKKPKGNSVA